MKHTIRLFILIAALALGTDHAWADAESNPRVNFVYVDGDNYALTSDKGVAIASDEAAGQVTITVTINEGKDFRCIEGDLTAEQSINSGMGQARRRTSAEDPGNGVPVAVACTKTNEFTLTLPDDESTNVTVYVRFSEKAPLTVTANDVDIDLGEEAKNGGVRYSDFEGDDDESVLEGTLSYAFGKTVDGSFSEYHAGYPVGDYQIIPSGLTSADYKITFVPGTLTVNLTNIVTQRYFYYYFDEYGELRDNVTFDELIFQGEFSGLVETINISKKITLTGDNAVLKDMGLCIIGNDVTVTGFTLNEDNAAFTNSGAAIYVSGSDVTLNNVSVTYDAPSEDEAKAIFADGADNFALVNSEIIFTGADPGSNYYRGLEVSDCDAAKIDNNTISAVLPAVDVDWANDGIDQHHVLAVGIQGGDKVEFTNNIVTVNTNGDVGDWSTIDAVMIQSAENILIKGNKITLIDNTTEDDAKYSLDIYSTTGTVEANDIIVNTTTTAGDNRAGSASLIQLTGPFTVTVKDNNLTGISKGFIAGIYATTWSGKSYLTVENNNIDVTGYATTDNYDLVAGIEAEIDVLKAYNNTIAVKNTADYDDDNQVIGVGIGSSFFYGDTSADIKDNNMIVDGKYAVYYAKAINTNVTGNALCAHELTGDHAVNIADGDGNTVENNILGYVMPKTGESTYDIPANVSSFKVFDDGGKGRIYSPGCDGTLTLNAPTGYVLQLSGNITTEKDVDYLTVYDGSDNQADVLIDQVSSSVSGELTDIPTVTSTGQSITLHFCSDNSVNDISEYDGLDLTVSLISPATLFAADATNKWMTWCDKYAYVKPKGVTVYTVSSVATDKVTLAEVSGGVIPAYTPVILYRAEAGEDAVTATFSAVGTAPASGYDAANGICSQSNQAGTFTFFGATTAMAKIPDNDFTYYNGGLTYVLYGDKFLKTDSNNGIAANRCWLKLDAEGGTGPVNARQLVIVVDDETTAVESEKVTVNSEKFAAATVWYTLDGRKLSGKPTKKGLYIYNGKKTVVK